MHGDASVLDTLTLGERAALRAVLVRATAAAGPRRDDAQLAGVVAAAPIESLPAAAALHRVGGSVLRGLEGIDGVPPAVRAALTAMGERAAVNHLVVVGGLSQISEAFDAADLSWLVMKGPVLASRLYPDIGDRAYGDLDLLVSRADYPRAMDILEELGFAHTMHNWALAERMLAGQVSMTNGRLTIDLHWHLHYSGEDRRPFALDPDAMLERSRRDDVSGLKAPILEPVDQLVTLAFHAARSDGHCLVWVKDIERSLAVEEPDLDELVRRCRDERCAPPVGVMLGRSSKLLDADVPPETIAALTPRTLRGADRVVCAVTHPIQLNERPTVTRVFTRSVRSSLAATVGEIPIRAARRLAWRLNPPAENETDNPAEKASYLPRRHSGARALSQPSAVDDNGAVRGTLRTIRLAVSLVYQSGRRQLLVIVGATVITSAAIAGQLLAGRALLDLLAEDRRVDAGELAPYLAVLGVLLMIAAISQAFASELRVPLSEQVARHTMDEVLDVATEIELEAYEGSEFHDRLQRARLAAGAESSAVVFGLVTIISTLVVTVGVVLVLITVAPVLVPIALLGYVPITLVNVRNNRARYQLEVEQTELLRNRSYLEFVLTDRNEAKEVRAYDLAPTFRRWHAELWDRRMAQLQALARRRLTMTTVGSFITTAVLIATLSFALILAGRGSISIGDAAVAIVGLQQLSSRLQAAGTAFGSVHEGLTFLRDFESFRAALPVIRERRPTAVPPTPPNVVTVAGLGYRYPGASTDAVRSISFELRRGQVMAVVGANGSGKTTLAKLMCDLLAPTRGSIQWDGVDLSGCDPSLVRAQIAPVFQDFARYMVTIRRVIGLGDSDRMDDEPAIWAAAQQVGMAEVIESLPSGLDTRLGKAFLDGTDLSIGQWQRLAIARALYRDAPVVLLDEPSASLDPRAEAELFDLLQMLCEDRIVVFVSHRFATVRSADVVLVLDQGEVVEMGSHDELMSAAGLYHDLFNLQADRYGFAH